MAKRGSRDPNHAPFGAKFLHMGLGYYLLMSMSDWAYQIWSANVVKLSDTENIMTLKSGLRVTQPRSLKIVPIAAWVQFPIQTA